MPLAIAKRALVAKRAGSPTSVRMSAAPMAPMPRILVRVVPLALTSSLISAARSAIWRFSSRICRRRPRATRAGVAGEKPRDPLEAFGGGERGAGAVIAAADLRQVGVQPVDVRCAGLDQFTAVAGEPAQFLERPAGSRRRQVGVAGADAGNQQRVQRIGLGGGALGAPSRGGHLRRHVHHLCAGLAQSERGGSSR